MSRRGFFVWVAASVAAFCTGKAVPADGQTPSQVNDAFRRHMVAVAKRQAA